MRAKGSIKGFHEGYEGTPEEHVIGAPVSRREGSISSACLESERIQKEDRDGQGKMPVGGERGDRHLADIFPVRRIPDLRRRISRADDLRPIGRMIQIPGCSPDPDGELGAFILVAVLFLRVKNNPSLVDDFRHPNHPRRARAGDRRLSAGNRIPFSSMQQIQTVTSPAGMQKVWMSQIRIAYHDGFARELGSVSEIIIRRPAHPGARPDAFGCDRSALLRGIGSRKTDDGRWTIDHGRWLCETRKIRPPTIDHRENRRWTMDHGRWLCETRKIRPPTIDHRKTG